MGDCKSPRGGRTFFTADLQSAVKKVRPINTGGFVIPPIKVNVSFYLVFFSLCYFEINNIVCTFKMKV